MPLPERRALVERFRARNGAWTVTLGAGTAPDDVDPIRGVVRRATRDAAAPDASARTPVTEERAIAETAAFLGKNADLLGFSAADVPALDLVAGPAKTTAYGTWVVHARGTSPMRGYEGFDAVTSRIDVLAYLGDDGGVRYFVNLSHVHPRLSIDTAPLLGPDDKRLLQNVLGRPLFVVVDDPDRPNARVRELRRIPLGVVAEADVRTPRLTIDVSPGPRFAYVSYALAYAVDVVKDHTPFRFVVDADTGTLLEDPVVPIVTPSEDDSE
ncbi:MAG TPA: hypothetical protein VLT33_01845 [Labilithrix sp.]|nr:hypothetical protein [Labilithrix sp.]